MLVQELHEIQHRVGYLPKEELEALSERIKVPLRRLHEVASCFPHFRFDAPPAVDVRVCRDMSCHIQGGPRFQQALEGLAAEIGGGQIVVRGVSCLGRCDSPPALVVNDRVYWNKSLAEARLLVREALFRGEAAESGPIAQRSDRTPLPWKIDPYFGGRFEPYAASKRLADSGDAAALIEQLKVAELRGMGGAGVPTHQKWSDVRSARGDEKYVVCNADESEPSTFKDRELMLRAPHLVVEGVILAGMVVGATKGYIYIRHEYEEAIEVVREEIDRAVLAGAFGAGRFFPVEVFVSPGGYICGEQSALIEAMEDRRAEPRNKPPQLETNGLYDKPTVVNNVETLAWAPAIALEGGAWYRDGGVNGCRGMRFFSVCGDLEKPGVHEVPIGVSLGELVARCGGMRAGQGMVAIATSGPSGGFLPAKIPVATLPEGCRARLPEEYVRHHWPEGATHIDLSSLWLDIDFFRAVDLMLGAGMVVYGERADMLDQAVNATEFFRNESCGKCVPCRNGSQRLVEVGRSLSKNQDSASASEAEAVVEELNEALKLTSICGLGMVAGGPLASYFRYFKTGKTPRP